MAEETILTGPVFVTPILEFYDTDYVNMTCTRKGCHAWPMGQATHVVHDEHGVEHGFLCLSCHRHVMEVDEMLRAEDDADL